LLTTRMMAPSFALRPFVWSYGHTQGVISGQPLRVPLPARPKQVLMFFFQDRYDVHRHDTAGHGTGHGTGHGETSPRSMVAGPQTFYRLDLAILGIVDVFTIHFQPAGFHHLFGTPMCELTDASYDADGVIGVHSTVLRQRLSSVSTFEERILIAEKYLLRRVRARGDLDQVAREANRLFASNGTCTVARMAARVELTERQLERRFLAQVGVSPKLYSRVVRFSAALDRKLNSPGTSWTDIAHDFCYYDQMHMVHDFRDLAGDSPTRFLGRINEVPQFQTAFRAANRPNT